MDTLEHQLVDINHALVNLATEITRITVLQNSHSELIPGGINTGVGDDVVIVNESNEPGLVGPTGPTGPQGTKGDPGKDCECAKNVVKCKTVTEDYEIQTSDYYIGVSGRGTVTLYLPSNPPDGKQYIIKMEDVTTEMGTVMILCKEVYRYIDGDVCYVIHHQYGAVHIMYHNDSWHILASYAAGRDMSSLSEGSTHRKEK